MALGLKELRVGDLPVTLTSMGAFVVPSEPGAASLHLQSCGRRNLSLKLWPVSCAMQGDLILVLTSTYAPHRRRLVPVACDHRRNQKAKEKDVSFGGPPLRMGDSLAPCHLHFSEGFKISSATRSKFWFCWT